MADRLDDARQHAIERCRKSGYSPGDAKKKAQKCADEVARRIDSGRIKYPEG